MIIIMIFMTDAMIALDYIHDRHDTSTRTHRYIFVGFKVTKISIYEFHLTFMKYVISLILPHVKCYFFLNLPRTVRAEPASVQFEQIHVTCTVVNERTWGPSSVLRRPLKTSAASWLSS